MSLQEKSSSLVKELFREYYSRADLILPSDIEYREFAYQPFGSESYVRHLSFRSRDEVILYFSEKPPLHLYYSSATYLYPYADDMEAKGWRGSDLLFDIDADHVPECVENRFIKRLRLCPECGVATEDPDKECPGCSGETIDIIDPRCIEHAKQYTIDLVDLLMEDFGISRKSVKIMFSGNRGFHVRVEEEEWRSLGRDERRIIAEYVSAKGVGGEESSFSSSKEFILPPRISDYGLRRRIALRILRRSSSELIKRYISSSLEKAREIVSKNYKDLYKEYINYLGVSPSIPIDEMVTIDISRLVRIPNSINGKSGLLAIELSLADLESFRVDPEKHSPFRDQVVLVETRYDIPSINILGIEFRARRNTLYKVPGYIGVFLELKNLGRIKRIL